MGSSTALMSASLSSSSGAARLTALSLMLLTACGSAQSAAAPNSETEAPQETGPAVEPGEYAEAGTQTERGFVLEDTPQGPKVRRA